jgi:hypothetical protein
MEMDIEVKIEMNIEMNIESNISKNQLFAFTSVGFKLDKQLANASQGIYTFRAQGRVYHAVGDLLPPHV